MGKSAHDAQSRAVYDTGRSRSIAALRRIAMRGNRRRHWLALSFGVLVVLWMLYVILGNALLAGRLQAAARRAGFELSLESARTFWPGRVSMRGLELSRAGGSWHLFARKAKANVDVTALLQNALSIERLRADGVVVKLDWTEAGSLKSAEAHTLKGQRHPRPKQLGLARASGPFSGTEKPIFHVEQLEANGRELILGSFRLQGALHYEIPLAVLSDSKMVGRIATELQDVRVVHSGRTAAILKGEVSLELPDEQSKPPVNVYSQFDAEAKLQGELIELAAIFDGSPPNVELEGGALTAYLKFERGVLKQGSNLTIGGEQIVLHHADGAVSRLPSGAELELRMLRRKELPIQAELVSPRLELLTVSGRTWASIAPLKVSAWLTRDMSSPIPHDSKGRESSGHMRVTSPELTLEALESSFTSALNAELDVTAVEPEKGAVEFGSGVIRLPGGDLHILDNSTNSYDIRADLQVSHAKLSLTQGLILSGRAKAEGNDAEVLLDLADASESIRWTLSLLEGHQFEIDANLERHPDSLKLEPIRFSSSDIDMSALGNFHSGVEIRRGAFLIQRGPLSIGVILKSGSIETKAGVDEDWLSAHSKARLGIPALNSERDQGVQQDKPTPKQQ